MENNIMCFMEVCDTPISKLFVLVYIVSMVLVFAYFPNKAKEKNKEKL